MIRAELTEEMVLNPPPGMENYRAYRIEYGGCNKDCIIEGRIWIPAHIDRERIEDILNEEEP